MSTRRRPPGSTLAAVPAGLCPTQRWLAHANALVPLEGSAGVAERLLLLLHYGIDWQDGWVGVRRNRYWDHLLPDRVLVATYLASNLRRWWAQCSAELQSRPRNSAERSELEGLLRANSADVLDVLRWETEPLLLRVRIVVEAVRARRAEDPQ